MKKSLVLVGGGGHCKSVIEVAESVGYTVVAILDTAENVGKKILAYRITGTDEEIELYTQEAEFIVTVGQIKEPALRIRLHERIAEVGGKLATLVASTATVSRYAQIAEGSVIMHYAHVNADARIGRGCIINTFANIEHDVRIGDYCHISTGVMINGNCEVGSGTFVGSGTVLVNGISITDGCVIAAGSTVRKNVVRKGIYSGNPALLKIKL